MLSTLPFNFLHCAQVDTKFCMRSSIDEPCMFEASQNLKDELTDKKYFWLICDSSVFYSLVLLCI